MATLTGMDNYFDYEKNVIDIKGLRTIAESLPVSGSLKDILLSMLL